MVLFIGQVARGQSDREAFQEIDYRAMYGPIAKWVAQIEDAARIPEYVNRAFHTASAGRPGPVLLRALRRRRRTRGDVRTVVGDRRPSVRRADAVSDRYRETRRGVGTYQLVWDQ